MASYETINTLAFGTDVVVVVENITVLQIQEWKASAEVTAFPKVNRFILGLRVLTNFPLLVND